MCQGWDAIVDPGASWEVGFPTAALYLVRTASDRGSGVVLVRRGEFAAGIAR